VRPWGTANTNYRLSLTTTALQSSMMDVTTMTPVPDYAGHVGADYMGPEGTPVMSPVSGRVVAVQPVNGYGTMAVAIEVTLPTSRSRTRLIRRAISGKDVACRMTTLDGHATSGPELSWALLR
jgi:hypothetical protein